MSLESLDPRVARLQIPDEFPEQEVKKELDQFQTFEIFHQKKEGAAYTYVGPVHAPNIEVAFLYGKEQYGRRFSCTGMWVAETKNVMVTPYSDDKVNVYDILPEHKLSLDENPEKYEIFQLKKRGKAHSHVGTIEARSYEHALQLAKQEFGQKPPCVNIWVVKADDLFKSEPEDKQIWETTTEKSYRDAIAYRVMDRINKFKEEQKNLSA